MKLGDYCVTRVVTCGTEASVGQVAQLMRQHCVGAVVIVDHVDDQVRPLGLITDRDIATEVVALDLDARVFTAGDMMSEPLVTIGQDVDVFDALQCMRQHALRRLPVVNQAGGLYGIISIDDIINRVSAELSLVTAAMMDQTQTPRHAPHAA